MYSEAKQHQLHHSAEPCQDVSQQIQSSQVIAVTQQTLRMVKI